MLHATLDCPYDDWKSVARDSCRTPEHFHYLRDENGKVGGMCTEPIWVEKGNCLFKYETPVERLGGDHMGVTLLLWTTFIVQDKLFKLYYPSKMALLLRFLRQ